MAVPFTEIKGPEEEGVSGKQEFSQGHSERETPVSQLNEVLMNVGPGLSRDLDQSYRCRAVGTWTALAVIKGG